MHQAFRICFSNFHDDQNYECTVNTVNVCESHIMLHGNSEASIAAITLPTEVKFYLGAHLESNVVTFAYICTHTHTQLKQ